MISSSSTEIRRCRPLLGTFVEITAEGLAPAPLQQAIDRAFTTIERIQQTMSVHDEASEISLVNRLAFLEPVKVSEQTFAVLEGGLDLAKESKGAFDFTVAATLAKWGLLPKHLRRTDRADWTDVTLHRDSKVSFARPLSIDLGGIAKGYAVDTAIESLQASGVTAAVVNAGGDLRVFGSEPSTIHLRHPSHPQRPAHTMQLCGAALATSSPCFSQRVWRGQNISHLVDSAKAKAITGGISVTVRARECWMADALTKVVLNAPDLAETLLSKYEAEALILTA
jgi:thiamine biosynthesis lipoprotein